MIVPTPGDPAILPRSLGTVLLGWLKDLMNAVDPPVPSYDVLASGCLAHPAWPSGMRSKSRSLAALLSKLDRGIELEWLADRDRVQEVLAVELRCPLARIRSVLEDSLRVQEAPRGLFRLPGAPRARPLELAIEPLPPGISEVLGNPRLWTRLLWPSGSTNGVALVAAWLEARGLAKCTLARTVDEALVSLSDALPNFVWLQVPDPHLERLPQSGLCVVSSSLRSTGETWERVPEFDRVSLPAVVSWLAERLPADGRLDVDAALVWLDAHSDLLVDWDDAIGLVSLLDEFGVALVKGKSALLIAQAFVARRVREGGIAKGDTQWLQEHAFSLLVGVAKASCIESDLPFDAPRSRQEWIALVPEEFRRSVDVEWAKASIKTAGAPVSVAELERALAKVPPGAYRAATDLESAGLLVECGADRLVLSPGWLRRIVTRLAHRELIASSPAEWGEGLLRLHAEHIVERALFESMLEGDFSALESVLEFDDDDGPGMVAAVEALVRATGRILLLGAEPEFEELVALWRLVSKYAIRRQDGTPMARVGSPGDPNSGAFILGLWVLAGAIHRNGKSAGGPLDPHLGRGVTVGALDAVADFLESQEGADWVYAAYGHVGLLATAWPQHPCSLPSQSVAIPSWANYRALSTLRHGLPTLRFMVTRSDDSSDRTSAWAPVAADIWLRWQRSGFPRTTLFDSPGAQQALWQFVPVDVLRGLLQQSHSITRGIPFDALGRHQWDAFLLHTDVLPPDLCRTCSSEKLPPVLAAALRLRNREGLIQLWLRFRDSMLSMVEGAFEEAREGDLAELLWSVPPEFVPETVQRLSRSLERLGVAHPGVMTLRQWLLEQCHSRQNGFRSAYSLLSDVEKRLSRAERARGTSHPR